MSIKVREDTFTASLAELKGVTVVHAWSVVKCDNPQCPAAHVFFFDEDDVIIAHMPMTPEVVTDMLRDVCQALSANGGIQ